MDSLLTFKKGRTGFFSSIIFNLLTYCYGLNSNSYVEALTSNVPILGGGTLIKVQRGREGGVLTQNLCPHKRSAQAEVCPHEDSASWRLSASHRKGLLENNPAHTLILDF